MEFQKINLKLEFFLITVNFTQKKTYGKIKKSPYKKL